MPIDKFGHVSNSGTQRGPTGAKGVGFFLTEDANYDMKTKRLTNVGKPVDDTDCVTLGYIKQHFKDIDYSRYETLLAKHIEDIPFVITGEGDFFLKPKKIVNTDGSVTWEKRKVKNIDYPTHNEDSTNRKFVIDAIDRKFDEIPFKVLKSGDIEFSDCIIINSDGTEDTRKRKLINLSYGASSK